MDQHSDVLNLYRTVALLRRAEEAIIRHYPENGMRTPMHMSMGQEAAPAGICHALGERVDVIATYRSHAPFLARTGDTDLFFAEMHGRITGTAEGKSGSMHLAAPDKGHLYSTAIVGGGLACAVGAAFAHKHRGNGRCIAVFFGDGAVEEGTFWESLNAARLYRVPVLFICEDNDLAVHTYPHVRRGYASLRKVAEAFEIPYLLNDDNDPMTVRTLTLEAEALMASQGPVLMHVKCYRYLEHVGIRRDFHIGYREEAVYERWLARDCVALQRCHALAAGFKEETLGRLEQEIDQQVAASIDKALRSPPPGPHRLHAGVFHETH